MRFFFRKTTIYSNRFGKQNNRECDITKQCVAAWLTRRAVEDLSDPLVVRSTRHVPCFSGSGTPHYQLVLRFAFHQRSIVQLQISTADHCHRNIPINFLRIEATACALEYHFRAQLVLCWQVPPLAYAWAPMCRGCTHRGGARNIKKIRSFCGLDILVLHASMRHHAEKIH